jgi:hypothetical protein
VQACTRPATSAHPRSLAAHPYPQADGPGMAAVWPGGADVHQGAHHHQLRRPPGAAGAVGPHPGAVAVQRDRPGAHDGRGGCHGDLLWVAWPGARQLLLRCPAEDDSRRAPGAAGGRQLLRCGRAARRAPPGWRPWPLGQWSSGRAAEGPCRGACQGG